MNISLAIDDYNDLFRMDEAPYAEALTTAANAVITSGGYVNVEFRYADAQPEVAVLIRTKEELAKWRDSIRRVTDTFSNSGVLEA